MSNHVDVKNIEPTTFEDRYFDEYEYYNLTDRYTGRFSNSFIVIVVVSSSSSSHYYPIKLFYIKFFYLHFWESCPVSPWLLLGLWRSFMLDFLHNVCWFSVKTHPYSLTCLLSVFTTECTSRKGRTKKEASCNTNRQNPAGHERKIVLKLQNAEKKSKEWRWRGACKHLFPR